MAKAKYNDEKAELDRIYKDAKEYQLKEIRNRRLTRDIPSTTRANWVDSWENQINHQQKRIKDAKEEKDAILRKHGINPRESYSRNNGVSLNEARNPNTEEANSIIRRWAWNMSDDKYTLHVPELTRSEIKLLQKYGITYDPYYSLLKGPNGKYIRFSDIKKKNYDFDFVTYLTKTPTHDR